MNETEFRQELKKEIEKNLGKNYIVAENENLIYKVIIDENLKYYPVNPSNPIRGNYAFQTDLLIMKKEIKTPLIVIEIKYGRITTHDILTYSAKAIKHKEIYPYLRYGLVIGGKNNIANKFFTHNIGFDFALAMENIKDDISELMNIINEQLDIAKTFLTILVKRKKAKIFSTKITIESKT